MTRLDKHWQVIDDPSVSLDRFNFDIRVRLNEYLSMVEPLLAMHRIPAYLNQLLKNEIVFVQVGLLGEDLQVTAYALTAVDGESIERINTLDDILPGHPGKELRYKENRSYPKSYTPSYFIHRDGYWMYAGCASFEGEFSEEGIYYVNFLHRGDQTTFHFHKRLILKRKLCDHERAMLQWLSNFHPRD